MSSGSSAVNVKDAAACTGWPAWKLQASLVMLVLVFAYVTVSYRRRQKKGTPPVPSPVTPPPKEKV